MAPGLLKDVYGVADGNPLLFDAQILSADELESRERAGFRQGQCRVRLIIAVEVFFDAQRPVGLDVAWFHEQGCELRDHGAGAGEEGEAVPVEVAPVPTAVVWDPWQAVEHV